MAGDVYFGYVSLLLPFDGSNGSTTFVDKSWSPKTVTPSGNAQISTAQSKFGGASGAFDGTSDFLTVPYSADFDLGSGDFTIEAWIYPTALSGRKIIATTRNATGADGGFFFTADGTALSAQCWGPTAGTTLGLATTASGAMATNTWQHVAYCRSGSTFRVFVNGVVGSTSATSSSAVASNSRPVIVGADPSTAGRDFQGYIDDLRITKGVARYTTNFTPPTAAFPMSGTPGTLSASESGADSFASSGNTSARGTIAATEGGADAATMAGAVRIAGAFAATESAQDAFAASGGTPAVSGSLAVVEFGHDTFAASGAGVIPRSGAMAAVESGADTFQSAGVAFVDGAFAGSESGTDTAAIAVSALIAGAMAAVGEGSDSFTAQGGQSQSVGSLAAVEAGADSLAASGAALVSALLAAIEAGEDTAAIVGQIASGGLLAVVETGHDTFAAIESAPSLDPSRTLVVSTEDRMVRIADETRLVSVARDDRVMRVAAENRKVLVSA